MYEVSSLDSFGRQWTARRCAGSGPCGWLLIMIQVQVKEEGGEGRGGGTAVLVIIVFRGST